jgi:hypothetical protein
MSIATALIVKYGSSGAECCCCTEHIALRWSAIVGWGGDYKHLVPPGPKQ